MELNPSLAFKDPSDMIKENFDIKPLTYFKIGGRARYFTDVTNEDELKEAIKFAKKKKVPFVILGAASNVLFADHGYDGLVIRMMVRSLAVDGTLLIAGAGVPNAVAVAETVKQGLGGFEWAIGIPGSIGGSIRGNAGCFSGEMKDVLETVRFLNTKTGKIEEHDNAYCEFGYRESIFKKKPHLVILSGTFRLRKSENPGLGQRLVRFYTSRRTEKQDIGSSSAGCIFKNAHWPENKEIRARLLRLFPDLADFAGQATIPAGFLIDRLGLKGRSIGKVSVSKKHGNFVINSGGASAEEVIMLIGLIKEHVHRKFGIHLEEEIQLVGF